MVDVEQVTDAIADLGEGPFWDESSGRMLWVDMFAPSLLATSPESGETERIDAPDRVAAPCARPLAGGDGFVVVGERDIYLSTAEGTTRFAELPLAEGVRANDGGCDPQGRLYVGTLAYDLTPERGAIWRISGDGEVEAVLEGTTISNGLGWSPDGSVAYFADSGLCRIDRFEFDGETGTFGERRTFAETDEEADGIPDGLCLDAEGGIWVALWGTGTVRRYDPDGSVSVDVKVDCPPVTACAFGGPDLETLFVTTSRYEDPYRDAPAGALFAFKPGVKGLPLHPFAPASTS